MTHPSYEQQARDWYLWREYVDLDAVMTIEEFEAMTVDERIDLIIETFGPETDQPTYRVEVHDGKRWSFGVRYDENKRIPVFCDVALAKQFDSLADAQSFRDEAARLCGGTLRIAEVAKDAP